VLFNLILAYSSSLVFGAIHIRKPMWRVDDMWAFVRNSTL
jgi:hypothetical protein